MAIPYFFSQSHFLPYSPHGAPKGYVDQPDKRGWKASLVVYEIVPK